jgi:hypothetical protein
MSFERDQTSPFSSLVSLAANQVKIDHPIPMIIRSTLGAWRRFPCSRSYGASADPSLTLRRTAVTS